MDQQQTHPHSTVEHDRETSDSSSESVIRRYAGESLATVLLVAGVILFVVPEPMTSVAGAGLILLGIAIWVADWWWD